jgi:hypothetical protein
MRNSATKSFKSSLITFGVTAISILFVAPAAIAEVFSWLPESIHSRFPTNSRLGNFVGLCYLATAIGGRAYLFLAFILNVFLLSRKQAPAWPKVLLWLLFFVAVLGLLGVEADLKHVRD